MTKNDVFSLVRDSNMEDSDPTCAVAQIKNKTQQCFESRKNANCLLDIIAYSEVYIYYLFEMNIQFSAQRTVLSPFITSIRPKDFIHFPLGIHFCLFSFVY